MFLQLDTERFKLVVIGAPECRHQPMRARGGGVYVYFGIKVKIGGGGGEEFHTKDHAKPTRWMQLGTPPANSYMPCPYAGTALCFGSEHTRDGTGNRQQIAGNIIYMCRCLARLAPD